MKKGGLEDKAAPESPFARLAALRDTLPATPAVPAGLRDTVPVVKAVVKPVKGPAKAVVRMEKKGRGGKEVTIVEQLDLPAPELEAWLKDLKAKLGCGGSIEDAAIVLAGDLRKRVAPLLEARGVRQ
ncbi:MAG: translation initiation factor [Myxococcota bacterium]